MGVKPGHGAGSIAVALLIALTVIFVGAQSLSAQGTVEFQEVTAAPIDPISPPSNVASFGGPATPQPAAAQPVVPVGTQPAPSGQQYVPTNQGVPPNATPQLPGQWWTGGKGGSFTDSAPLIPIERGQLLARVGGDVILASDILFVVDDVMEARIAALPAEQRAQLTPKVLELGRQTVIRAELMKLIDTKLLLADAKRTIPAENLPKVFEKLSEQFDQKELPRVYKITETSTPKALDEYYKRVGTSLAQQRQHYCERMLASEWLRQQLKFNEEISHDELLAYYRAHAADYEHEAQARFEEIMVRYDRFPNKAVAYQALAELGNRVFRDAPFAEVAQAASHGVTASKGGAYAWVRRGSLVSQEVNRAVFTLPVGQLSRILEGETGFHIVRVTERVDAGRKPFEEAQVEIKKKLRRDRIEVQVKEYTQRVRQQTRVWTIFDQVASTQPTQAVR